MQEPKELSDDVRTLHRLGYAQEFARVLGGFSNFAISFTIVNILAGGITSFHQGFCSVGGASIGIAWPVAGIFGLIVAATMGQIASAFPTAGGLYHWASILGGRGWGWATGWFNLLGLIAVLAAINVGTYQFTIGAFAPDVKFSIWTQLAVVSLITLSHAAADIQIVIGDGLSATAVAVQVPSLLDNLYSLSRGRNMSFGRPFFVRYCRVNAMNDIGDLIAPKVLVLLIGERPGLATAESLSAYMAYRPQSGHTDANRNLISNIHARGVKCDEAARRIFDLTDVFRTAKRSGVGVTEVFMQLPGST